MARSSLINGTDMATAKLGKTKNKPRNVQRHALSRAVASSSFRAIEVLEGRVLMTAAPAHTFNFNSGLNGFTSIGNASVEDSSFYSPVQGGQTAQALVSTGAAFNGGSTPVSATTLEANLGLSAGTLTAQGFGTATNGSAIAMPGTIIATAGQVITFNADFLTAEPTGGQNDFGFAVLTGGGSSTVIPLGNAQQNGLASPSLSNEATSNFTAETRSQPYSVPIPANGIYTISFGVVNVGDKYTASGLLINNISIPDPISGFDFGSATSPIATNYAQATPATVYNADQGFGWMPGGNAVSTLDTGLATVYGSADSNMTRDFNYSTSAKFAEDVPNGLYDVTVTLGDARGYSYTNNLYFQNSSTTTDTVLTGSGGNPSVVTKTYQVAVTTGQLDLGIAGSSGTYAVLDGFSAKVDATPFAVSSSAPANNGTVSNSFSTMSITMSRPIDLTTGQTVGNYSLVLPNGSTINPSSAVVNGSQVTLTFANQTAAGAYNLSLSSAIHDIGGISLVPGNVTFTNVIATVPSKFDFGTAASAVASGYTSISGQAYAANLGYGWLSGTVGTLDTNVVTYTAPDSSLTRDFNYTTNGTFAVNVPASGLYDVTVTFGDARGFTYPQNISFNGSATDTLTTGGSSNPAVITKTYVVAVSGTQLQVGLSIAAGGTYALIDGLSFVADNSAFSIASSTPANGGTVTGSFSQVAVSFSHPVSAASEPLPTLTGPNGAISLTNAVQTNPTTITYSAGTQSTAGGYTLSFPNTFVDGASSSLSGLSSISFTDAPVPIPSKFDFGTATSSVAAGYTQVVPTTTFGGASGYGWLSGTVGSLDTGNTTFPSPDPAATRDFDYTTNGSFAISATPGLYDVTVTLGDARGYTYPQTVSFGGNLTDTLTTGGTGNAAVVSRTYGVNVSATGTFANELVIGLGVGTGGSYAVIDALSYVHDNSAFALTSSNPANSTTVSGPISSVTLNFNHPLASTATTLSDYNLTLPNSSVIQPTAVTIAGQVATLTFGNQVAAGSYSLAVTGVQDTGGNSLGSTTVAFTDVAIPVPTKYDFGSATSPVASGFTQVTPTTGYGANVGYGWLSGTIGSLDTSSASYTTPDALVTRDFDYTTNGTFRVGTSSNGLYDVTLTLGDARGFTYPQTISINGSLTDTVTTGGSSPAVINKTYVVSASNYQIDVGLAAALGGTYAVIDGLTLTPDSSAFAISSSTPANGGSVNVPVNNISVSFSHPVGSSALVAGNYSLTGPGSSAVAITGVTQVNPSTINLQFASQTTLGSYSLAIGSGVQDAGGSPLNPSTVNFSLVAGTAPTKFDFGTASSAVASGWNAVTDTTAFTNTLGYGWQSGTIGSLDTGIISYTNPDPSVTRDFNYTKNGQFAVNIASGTYHVTLTLGDANGYSYSFNVNFENGAGPQAVVNTGGSNPAIINQTYTVVVTGGQLDLGLTGVSNAFAVVDGLTIAP